MYCPRIEHFVRLNPIGTVSRCGHMVNPVEFATLTEMDESEWLLSVKEQFAADKFPQECIRCQQTERHNNTSIRLNSLNYHQTQRQSDYLIVGGVLDNICNSACQMCNEQLSTKIGKLTNINVNHTNINKFWQLPLHRVTHLDINGGEPSVSKNYREVLRNIPPNVKSIRINTNCSVIIKELPELLDRGIQVTVTVSFDGIGLIHDYIRWPIKWDKFYDNLMIYKSLSQLDLNLWTTVSALNVGNLTEIIKFAVEHEIHHSYSFLHAPSVLDIRNTNKLTVAAKETVGVDGIAINNNNDVELLEFITQQDAIRNISYKDYLNILL